MDINYLKDNNLILFEAIAGSKAFGLDTPTSDTDIKGVFYLPKRDFYGLNYIPQISNSTNDVVYYELGRFVELLLKNNPNILELLASPDDCILYKHPIMNAFMIQDFLSKLCKDTIVGYAQNQIKKARGLNKKIVNPMDAQRKSLLDFCYVLSGYSNISLNQWLQEQNKIQELCGLVAISHLKNIYALFYDDSSKLHYKGILKKENSNELLLSSVPKEKAPIAYIYCNSEGYSSYCKKYKEYWEWVEQRNQERYLTNEQHGKNYDSKNMMHTIRLLQYAKCIFETGTLNVRVTNRSELLSIKAGEKSYDEILLMTETLLEEIEQLYVTSTLPETPNHQKAIDALVRIREKLYSF